MKTFSRKFVETVAHSGLVQEVVKYKEKRDLDKLRNPEYQLQNLACTNAVTLHNRLHKIFQSKEAEAVWNANAAMIKGLHLPEMTGGVNLGDQRAIFYLIHHLKPGKVLEIGTHIGCSTVHIAAALKAIPDSRLTTVDIIDVNDTLEKPWEDYSSTHSPRQLMALIGAEAAVRFVKDDSISFLKNYAGTFDFIFLDGSHKAKMVYREIPLALKLLNRNGLILLHDYFPGARPLWPQAPVIPGPYLAVRKIMREESYVDVIPLGELPWETKNNSRVTSLALLIKKEG